MNDEKVVELIGMKLARSRARLTRDQLAKETGISAAMLYRFESGLSEPTLSKSKIIADALGITINDLF